MNVPVHTQLALGVQAHATLSCDTLWPVQAQALLGSLSEQATTALGRDSGTQYEPQEALRVAAKMAIEEKKRAKVLMAQRVQVCSGS